MSFNIRNLALDLRAEHHPEGGNSLHVDFANMYERPAGLMRFAKRWGPPVIDRSNKLDPKGTRVLVNFLRTAWCEPNGADWIQSWIQSCVGGFRFLLPAKGGLLKIGTSELWPVIFLLVLRDCERGLAGFCGNPGCHAPFYIRKHKGDKFCGTDCARYGQRVRNEAYQQRRSGERAA